MRGFCLSVYATIYWHVYCFILCTNFMTQIAIINMALALQNPENINHRGCLLAHEAVFIIRLKMAKPITHFEFRKGCNKTGCFSLTNGLNGQQFSMSESAGYGCSYEEIGQLLGGN